MSRWLVLLGGPCASLLLTASTGCMWIDRGRQVRTHANMQTIVRALETLKERGALTTSNAEASIAAVSDGLDGWGRRYIFRQSGDSYLLISTGSDGELDVSSPSVYFGTTFASVAKQYDRDIVFRDGAPVRSGGK